MIYMAAPLLHPALAVGLTCTAAPEEVEVGMVPSQVKQLHSGDLLQVAPGGASQQLP